MTIRKELLEALRVGYRSAAFGEQITILDEFAALTGNHRKHAIQPLRQQGGLRGDEGDTRTQSAVRRGSTPGVDGVVGSGRQGLRQAPEDIDPDVG